MAVVVVIAASVTNNKLPHKGNISMEVIVNGVRYNIGDNTPLADALKIQQEQLDNLKAAKLKVGDKQFSIGDELEAIQAVVDQLHAEKTALEQKVGDLEKNQMTPENLNKLLPNVLLLLPMLRHWYQQLKPKVAHVSKSSVMLLLQKLVML